MCVCVEGGAGGSPQPPPTPHPQLIPAPRFGKSSLETDVPLGKARGAHRGRLLHHPLPFPKGFFFFFGCGLSRTPLPFSSGCFLQSERRAGCGPLLCLFLESCANLCGVRRPDLCVCLCVWVGAGRCCWRWRGCVGVLLGAGISIVPFRARWRWLSARSPGACSLPHSWVHSASGKQLCAGTEGYGVSRGEEDIPLCHHTQLEIFRVMVGCWGE